MSPEAVRDYLDDFYDVAIPLIGSNDGMIEKILGDGIIVTFGPPFHERVDDGLRDGITCAREIICELSGTRHEAKCALRRGEVCFTYVGGDEYTEATMVGNTLLELWRLESVSVGNSLSVFDSTPEADWLQREKTPSIGRWQPRTKKCAGLSGVDFGQVYYEQLMP